jgi:transcriptional regulator with XRE-family HTH domain
MQPRVRTGEALAGRLRELRLRQWPSRKLTQQEVGSALGVSVPLISSWESNRRPAIPPDERLLQLATFYCTRRSIEGDQPQVLPLEELTAPERATREQLINELQDLRQLADGPSAPATGRVVGARRGRDGVVRRQSTTTSDNTIAEGPWLFEDMRPVTIVCARLPEDLRATAPYSDPADPDYVKLYTVADLDALLELHGHIRAVNPNIDVHIRVADELVSDDFTTHLVLLGGVDWNPLTRELVRKLTLPVQLPERADEAHPYDACFVVGEGTVQEEFRPVLNQEDSIVTLMEDIGHFYRGPNPFNAKRTVTICNGMFARGTYGAVRTLTDARFRKRNADYVRSRFPRERAFSILARVPILNGEVVTPDWTVAENRLHEWPGVSA